MKKNNLAFRNQTQHYSNFKTNLPAIGNTNPVVWWPFVGFSEILIIAGGVLVAHSFSPQLGFTMTCRIHGFQRIKWGFRCFFSLP